MLDEARVHLWVEVLHVQQVDGDDWPVDLLDWTRCVVEESLVPAGGLWALGKDCLALGLEHRHLHGLVHRRRVVGIAHSTDITFHEPGVVGDTVGLPAELLVCLDLRWAACNQLLGHHHRRDVLYRVTGVHGL